MRSKFEKVTLIFIGLFLGLLISVNLPVFADKTKSSELPIEDLRTFAEVFGKIKTDYVEVVEDKKLLSEALSGMLSGLDPHSTYLDLDHFTISRDDINAISNIAKDEQQCLAWSGNWDPLDID